MKNFYAASFKRNANAFCPSMALLFIFMGVTPGHLFAQTPTVSYASATTYYIGLPVQLSPTSSGVAAPGYSSASPVGYLTQSYYISYDQHGGNIYATALSEYETQFGLQYGQTLYRIPPGGGTIVAVGSLTNATGVTADKSGNVWVADQIAKAVYKVPYGSNSLVLVASGFNNPQGLAVDASGNVYVADRGNAALEKIPASGGAWTTVVSGLSGANNVALDGAGNIFISANSGVFRVPAGLATASLYLSSSSPLGIAIDPSGALYVADESSQRITKYPVTGSSVAFPADQPTSVSLDQFGNVYCGSISNGDVERYKPTGGYYLETTLPAGLSFSNSTGVVSGTPTTVTGGQQYVVIAYNAAGSGSTAFGMAVANPPVPAISYASPQTYTPGVAIAPLAPASNYVAPLAYKGSPVTVGSGLVNPVGVAIDPNGNLFIADDQASVNSQPGIVYELPADGSGQGAPVTGLADPTSLATDAAGNLYISDTGNLEIFEMPTDPNASWPTSPELSAIGPITSDGAGNVYTFAPGDHTIYKLPTGLSGESPFASALNSPAGIAADFAGHVYVSDAGNNNIVKFNPDGSSAGVLASVQNPGPITVDAGGNLYVVNTAGNLYTIPAGTTTALQVGSGLTNASGLAIDGKGNIYYADINNHQVKKISPSGGYFLNTSLPVGLSCSNTTGIISGTPTAATAANYIVTAYNITGSGSTNLNLGIITLTISYSGPHTYTTGKTIPALTPASTGVAAPGYSGSPVTLGSGFKSPAGVAYDAAGNVYVADETNNAVYKIPAAGGTPVAIGSGFSSPLGVALDAAGDVFVADANNNAVKEIPVGGGAIITLGSGFKVPASVTVDAAGNVYVADFGNGAIKKIPVGGGPTITLATISTNTEGIAVDAVGNVYFGTVFGNQVKMIPAGSGALINVGSGFSQPRGVALDAAGNLYIADTGNNAIKEIPAGGGAMITLGSGFKNPEDVVIDPAGNIYVGDAGNAAVKKIKPIGGYFITPVMPAGLSFDKSTGIISGTPTVGSPATNYTVFAYNSSSSGTAVVNIKTVLPQTITFSALPPKTYGAADFAPGATSTNSSIAITYNSDNTAVATIVSGNIHIAGAGTANITATQAGDSTHAAANNVIQNLNVKQAPLIIIANNQTMTQGQSVPALTATYNGFVNGENPGSLTTLPSITTTGTSASPVGTYPITASGAATANYAISYVAGKLNITAPSSVATLGSLQISTGTLSPNFASTITGYTAAVANSVTSIAVTPSPDNPNAAITVNGAAVAGGASSGDIHLAVGANTITIVVTAQDGVTTATYTVTVTRNAPPNATLSALQLSTGTLKPVFDPATMAYAVPVGNAVTSIMVTPTASDPSATIKVNSTTVVSGTASAAILLNVGANAISIVTTGNDGVTTKTYTVTVTRAPSGNDNLSALSIHQVAISPTFLSHTTAYTATVANASSSIVVTATAAEPNATIKINGVSTASGTASSPVAVNVGDNTITVAITSQNGANTLNYTIDVTRKPSTNDALTTLEVKPFETITKTTGPDFGDYTVSVPNNISSMAVIATASDPTASITVNGVAATSGTASVPVALLAGPNTINTTVTAQDGVTKRSYVITVTRAPSSNAILTKLSSSPVETFTSVAGPGYKNYTASVPNTTSLIKIYPVTEDPTATVTVNGTTVASGSGSTGIHLAVGSNTITTVVTAQDGMTINSYIMTITRAAAGSTNIPDEEVAVALTSSPTLNDDGIMVHQAISPNGDGKNDFLTIENIANYPDNKLMIMNRNGTMVFEAKGYDNQYKVFDGHSNKNGEMQQPGTYFYSLDYTVNGIIKHKTGFLVLKY